MKLNRAQGISFFASVILFGIFTVISFLLPVEHTVKFWLGFFFAVFAIVVMFLSLFFFFTKKYEDEKALAMPVVVVSWIYFIIQLSVSEWEIVSFPFDYLPALYTNLGLALLFSVIILAVTATIGRIEKSEQYVAEKVLFIKELKNGLEEIETDDADLQKMIKALEEDVRYSDPMSHSKLAEIEGQIAEVVQELEENVSDTVKAKELCDKASKLLKKRNTQCKTLKGVKDEQATKARTSNASGNKVAIVGVGVTIALFLITLVVCFVIIPENKYKKGNQYFADEQYVEAAAVFTNLGDYKDSEEKLVEIENTIKYKAAVDLMEAEDYDGAIAVFEEIIEFSDSKNKITEINNILLDNKFIEASNLYASGDYEGAIAILEELGNYGDSRQTKIVVMEDWYDLAEEYFYKGEYEKAQEIYEKMNPYRDSQARLEAINNRQAEEDIFYFGNYDGETIAWRIIKIDGEKMLLMADTIIRELPISDDMSDDKFDGSDLEVWLNKDFLYDFGRENIDRIIPVGDYRVSLLTKSDIEELLEEGLDMSAESEWWLATASENGFMYVTEDGEICEDGDMAIRDKGVRPIIWITRE